MLGHISQSRDSLLDSPWRENRRIREDLCLRVCYVYGYGHFRPGMIICAFAHLCDCERLLTRSQCCVCGLMCAPGKYVHMWLGRGNGWLSQWHGARPSLPQRWVREQINYLNTSCCSLSTSGLSISMRLRWCTSSIPSVLSWRHHFATSTTFQWKYWGHAVSALPLWLLITATILRLSYVKWTWFIFYS